MKIKGKRVQVSEWMKWEKNRMFHWIYIRATQSGLVVPICICLCSSLNFTLFLFFPSSSLFWLYFCAVFIFPHCYWQQQHHQQLRHCCCSLFFFSTFEIVSVVVLFFPSFLTPLMCCLLDNQSTKIEAQKNLFIYNEDLEKEKETEKRATTINALNRAQNRYINPWFNTQSI